MSENSNTTTGNNIIDTTTTAEEESSPPNTVLTIQALQRQIDILEQTYIQHFINVYNIKQEINKLCSSVNN